MSTTKGASAFGQWLRQHRKASGLTQQLLAKHSGYAISTIRKLESGALRPSHQIIERLTAVLGLGADERIAVTRLAMSMANTNEVDEQQLASTTGRPVNVTRYPLPVSPTPLVGRDRELSELTTLIQQPDVRLLTLFGPGGIGKTRLGLAAAQSLREIFRDGICFVDLTAIGDPLLVPNAVARALNIAESTSTVEERLTTALRELEILLFLDNFEQVLPAATLLATLLAAAPGLKMLVTSRRVLQLRGEHIFPVAPLALPVLGRLPEQPELEHYPAVALFVARARAANPAFQLHADNAAVVAELCIRLDGLPLAIELAAARSRVLSPAALLARLDDRLSLLANGARDLPARQQTMRAAVEWSYRLLQPHEREIFARLAVFVGGCTFPAVEAIVNAPGPASKDLLDNLASLVDNSLLQTVTPAASSAALPRFMMLDTIREYALEQLSPEAETVVRTQHAAYYLQLAETAAEQLTGREQKHWLEQLDNDLANLRSALHWTDEQGASETVLRLSKALGRFWWIRGYLREGRGWLERGLAIATQASPVVRAEALYWLGILSIQQGETEHAEQTLRTSYALFETAGVRLGTALALNALGVVANAQDDPNRAATCYEASLQVYHELGDRERVATLMNNLGYTAMLLLDYDRATALLEESLAISHDLSDTLGKAYALHNLGLVALRRGDYAAARTWLVTALKHFTLLGDARNSAECMEALGELLTAEGRVIEGTRFLAAAAAQREALGVQLAPHEQIRHNITVTTAQNTLGETAFAAAWLAGTPLSPNDVATIVDGIFM